MLVAVEKIGKVIQGKYNNSQNQRIVMTCVDKIDSYGKKYYGLNLDPLDTMIYNKWMPYIKLGNVLDVVIKTHGGSYYVDKYSLFTVRRDLNKVKEN